jgi:guanylate kinase
VEWARVHGNYYGTDREFIERSLASGTDVLLDIDVQGAAQIVGQYPQSVTIFIMPPNPAVLEQRLASRGTESRATIQKRLANAKGEMEKKGQYRHVIINDRLSEAVARLIELVASYRSEGGENPTGR